MGIVSAFVLAQVRVGGELRAWRRDFGPAWYHAMLLAFRRPTAPARPVVLVPVAELEALCAELEALDLDLERRAGGADA